MFTRVHDLGWRKSQDRTITDHEKRGLKTTDCVANVTRKTFNSSNIGAGVTDDELSNKYMTNVVDRQCILESLPLWTMTKKYK